MKIAFITGANRGIGFEVAKTLAKNKDYTVVIGARDLNKAQDAARKIESNVECVQCDMESEVSISKAVNEIKQRFKTLHVLINNAGVFLDSDRLEASKKPASEREALLQSFMINTMGPLQLIQSVLPLMKAQNYGRIVNLSSGMGQLSEMGTGYPAYRLSKTALNAVTRITSQECVGQNILINSVCPGWVKTEMGGPQAPRSLEQGAETVLWAAMLPESGPSGSFFRDKTQIPW